MTPETSIKQTMQAHAMSAEFYASQGRNTAASNPNFGVDDNECAYNFARAAAHFAHALEGQHTYIPVFPILPWKR